MQKTNKEQFLKLLGQKLAFLREAYGVDEEKLYQMIDKDRLEEIENGIGKPIDVFEFDALVSLYHADASLLIDSVWKDAA